MSEELTPPPPEIIHPGMSAGEILDVLETCVVTTPEATKAADRLWERFRVNGPMTIADLRDLVLMGRYSRVAGMRDLIRGMSIEVTRIAMQAIQSNEADIAYLMKRGRRKYSTDFYKMRECNAAFLKVMNEAVRHLMQNEGTLAALPPGSEENELPIAASFAPGQKVTPPSSGTVVVAQNAHFHEASKQEKQEKPT